MQAISIFASTQAAQRCAGSTMQARVCLPVADLAATACLQALARRRHCHGLQALALARRGAARCLT